MSLDVRADSHKQVLRITNYNPDRSLYKPRTQSNLDLTRRQDTISSSGESFEAVTEDVAPTLTFKIEFAGIGISLINRRMVEVVFISMDTLNFEYINNTVAQAVNLSCGTLQVDNQLHDALFPVILQPTPIAKASGVASSPTVQASVIWLKDQGWLVLVIDIYSHDYPHYHIAHGVLFIKYCSILLQALTIEADEDLLFSIYDLSQIKGVSWEDGTEE